MTYYSRNYNPVTTQTLIQQFVDERDLIYVLTKNAYETRNADGTYNMYGFYDSIPRGMDRAYKNAWIDPHDITLFLKEKKLIVTVDKKEEVGTLFVLVDSYHNNFVTVDLMKEVAKDATLNPAQLHELERMLNKAGETLDIDLPPLPTVTEADMREAMIEVAREILMKKPRVSRDEFIKKISRKGFPIKLKEAEFKEAMDRFLVP